MLDTIGSLFYIGGGSQIKEIRQNLTSGLGWKRQFDKFVPSNPRWWWRWWWLLHSSRNGNYRCHFYYYAMHVCSYDWNFVIVYKDFFTCEARSLKYVHVREGGIDTGNTHRHVNEHTNTPTLVHTISCSSQCIHYARFISSVCENTYMYAVVCMLDYLLGLPLTKGWITFKDCVVLLNRCFCTIIVRLMSFFDGSKDTRYCPACRI